MQLHTGEALLFSPNAVVSTTGPSNGAAEVVTRLSAAYLKILTRPRITLDGGFSIMAVDPGGLPNTEISVPIHLSSDQASVSSLPAEISPPLEQSRVNTCTSCF
jgi:hypothetical protein